MISLDAVSSDDLAFLMEQPNFAKLRERSTLVRDVNSVFVSNTYPAHTSIITGVHPDKHGIIENVFLRLDYENEIWRYNSKLIKVPTLYQKAAGMGMKVCSILYPVTGGADIKYNFPEIPGTMSAAKRMCRMVGQGSKGFVISTLLRNIKNKGTKQPELDETTTQRACEILSGPKPELLMLHLIDTDDQKHRYGPDSEQAKESLRRHDRRIGRIIESLHDAGTYEETGIIIFSDHGCLPVHTAVNPNEFLERKGLIRDAYFHLAGGSAFLKLYNPEKEEEVLSVFEELIDEPYVRRGLTNSEMEISGMEAEYIAGIGAMEGYCFGKEHLGQHGYTLDRAGYFPFYMAAGQGIEEGGILSGGCIVDICPLAADMLGIPGWEMEGRNQLRGKS